MFQPNKQKISTLYSDLSLSQSKFQLPQQPSSKETPDSQQTYGQTSSSQETQQEEFWKIPEKELFGNNEEDLPSSQEYTRTPQNQTKNKKSSGQFGKSPPLNSLFQSSPITDYPQKSPEQDSQSPSHWSPTKSKAKVVTQQVEDNESSEFIEEDKFFIITNGRDVEEICDKILNCHPPPILGVDCEGLSKGRPLSLLQMFFNGKCFLFDLLKINPFKYGLDEVMRNESILKIFHDFCEDQSALINQYNVVCKYVFDTQIAHRVIQQAKSNSQKLVHHKDNNISLNDLLSQYLGVINKKKKEITVLMKSDDQFWEQRPLSKDMLEYATQDVLYLPLVYQAMQKEFKLKLVHQFYTHGTLCLAQNTVFEKIMRETAKCEKYAFINRHLKTPEDLYPGIVIQAFIKNYQEYGVFCSLNVGISGIVQDQNAQTQLQTYFDIGDVIQVQVERMKSNGRHVVLKFVGPPTYNAFAPPQVPRYQQKQQNHGQMQNYNPFSPAFNLHAHQNIQKQQHLRSLNVQSPAFVPDTSFSSSNGDNSYLNNTFNSDFMIENEPNLASPFHNIPAHSSSFSSFSSNKAMNGIGIPFSNEQLTLPPRTSNPHGITTQSSFFETPQKNLTARNPQGMQGDQMLKGMTGRIEQEKMMAQQQMEAQMKKREFKKSKKQFKKQLGSQQSSSISFGQKSSPLQSMEIANNKNLVDQE